MRLAKCPACSGLFALEPRPAVQLAAALACHLLAGEQASFGERVGATLVGAVAGAAIDEHLSRYCPECNVVLEVIADLAG